MGIRKNGGRSCISMLCVWFCGERHKSVSAAWMQQGTSLNQQWYVTAVVMFFFQFWSNYTTFDFRSSVVLFPPFCHVVKSSFGFCSKFHSSVSSLPRLNNEYLFFFVNSDLTVQSVNNLMTNNDEVDEGTLQKWDDRYVHLLIAAYDHHKHLFNSSRGKVTKKQVFQKLQSISMQMQTLLSVQINVFASGQN